MDVQATTPTQARTRSVPGTLPPLFGRDEAQDHAHRFVQGLLLGGDRRSVENIAEAIDGCVVRSLQKFIAQSPWSDDELVEELQRHVSEVLGDPDAALNVDETGFPKKGTKSVGVKRQYAGCLGRTDNCQIGVFVNYRSAAGHTLIDRRLFVPEEWAADGPRREEAGAPEAVVFRTKPELALGMVQQAVERGLPFRWVTADSVYGDSPTFVQGVRALGKWYVVDTSADARVWLTEPEVIPAGTKGRGVGRRPSRGRRPSPDGWMRSWRSCRPRPGSGSWSPKAVRGHGSTNTPSCGSGSVRRGCRPGAERLLVRRSLGQQAEVKYHRSNAPAEVPLEKLARVRGGHWSVEQSFEAAKGECGLDEYETRGWTGWHHHTALSLLALWFLGLQKRRLGEKRAADERARGAGAAGASARRAAVG